MKERNSASGAGHLSGTQARSGHTRLYLFGYLPENCARENLKAMCQGCHLFYDRDHHAQTRAATRAAALASWMDPLPLDLAAAATRTAARAVRVPDRRPAQKHLVGGPSVVIAGLRIALGRDGLDQR